MKIIIFILLISLSLFSKEITSNEVYSQVMIIEEEVHSLLKYYGIKLSHDKLIKITKITTPLRPRNVWQRTYEIMIKINILRDRYNLPVIEPINMTPVLNLNPDLVYEQTQRILTEIKIFKLRRGIQELVLKEKVFKAKTPLDVFNALSRISMIFDILNKGVVAPSLVFGENVRVYDDITLILQNLELQDDTIPEEKMLNATPADTYSLGLDILQKIKQLQIMSGISFVDFSEFKKSKVTSSDVFGLTQMIIAELQTIKAYLKIKTITHAAIKYNKKTLLETNQLMSWNLRKLNLINSLNKKAE